MPFSSYAIYIFFILSHCFHLVVTCGVTFVLLSPFNILNKFLFLSCWILYAVFVLWGSVVLYLFGLVLSFLSCYIGSILLRLFRHNNSQLSFSTYVFYTVFVSVCHLMCYVFCVTFILLHLVQSFFRYGSWISNLCLWDAKIISNQFQKFGFHCLIGSKGKSTCRGSLSE